MTAILYALKPENLPTPREETWKYTNLPRAMPKSLTPAPTEDKLIHKTRGQNGAQREDILFTGRDGTVQTPVLKIKLEQGVEATVIEHHQGDGIYWKNMETHIEVADGAILHHYRLQDDSEQAVHTNMVNITLGRDAVYDSFSLNIGATLSRHQMHAVLNGPNSECSLNGINLLDGKRHGDTTILMEHAAPHCRSNQFYRSILDDESRGVFQGKVHVHRIAQKTDGYQLSNALLLSPKAEMDTKPELEIYADDVKCSHGATTGQLDDEPLFYMRARGLNEAEARMLLMQAFVDEVVEKIGDEAFKTGIEAKVQAWLLNAL